MVMLSYSATELVNLQGKISNRPKENKTNNIQKNSLMGSEIKLSEKGATCYVKSLLERGRSHPSPLSSM